MKIETLKLIKKDYEEYKAYEIYKRHEILYSFNSLTDYQSFYNESLKYKTIDKEKLKNFEKFRKEVMNAYSYSYNKILNDDRITDNIVSVSLDDILSLALNLIFKKYVSQIDIKDTKNIYFNFGDINNLLVDDIEDLYNYLGLVPEEEAYAYKNLEQEETIIIPKEEVSKFESEHDFVYQINIDNYQFLFHMMKIEFPKIRTDFLLKAFDTDQEEAKKYVLKKYSLDAQYTQLEEYEKRFETD